MRSLTQSEILVVSGGGLDDPGWDNYDNPTNPSNGIGADGTTIKQIAPAACALIGIGVGLATENPAAGALAMGACQSATGSSGQTNSQPDRSTTATATCPAGSTPVTTTSSDGTTIATCAPGGAGGSTTTTTTGH